jgi:hypothetical protein
VRPATRRNGMSKRAIDRETGLVLIVGWLVALAVTIA